MANLSAINAEMYSKAPKKGLKSYIRFSQQFHFNIYQWFGTGDRVGLVELFWMRCGPMMQIVRRGTPWRSGRVGHAEVLEAIRKVNTEKAATAIRADTWAAAGLIRDNIRALTAYKYQVGKRSI